MKKTKFEEQLNESVNRFKSIVSYQKKLNETVTPYRYKFYEAEDDQPPTPQNDVVGDATSQMNQNVGQDFTAEEDPNTEQPEPTQDSSIETNPENELPSPEVEPEEQDQEIDITDLVHGNQEITHKIDDTVRKIEDLFSKISTIERSLTKMDHIIVKLGDLETQVELSRPPTEEERRKALAQKSYPYSVQPKEYENGTGIKNQTDLEKRGDKMNMMDNLMSDYSKERIKNSFYPEEEDQRNLYNV